MTNAISKGLLKKWPTMTVINVPNAKFSRWPCRFHVVCVTFTCVGQPTRTQFPVEYGLISLMGGIQHEQSRKYIYNNTFLSGEIIGTHQQKQTSLILNQWSKSVA